MMNRLLSPGRKREKNVNSSTVIQKFQITGVNLPCSNAS